MRRSVLAVAHRVVGEDKNCWKLHQGREPDGRLGVVAENEKGRAKRPELGEREAIHCRHHCVFADAVMEVFSAVIVRLEISRAFVFQRGLVRWAKIGWAAL